MQQSRKPWTIYQDQAVIQIIKQIGIKNWPLISTIMKQKYNIEERSGKQCRQRWYNQLNPQVNKQPWTNQEEKLLFQAHKTHKNKWIQISKLFIGRTDNSVKNHFYSTIRRSLRRICKLLGNKNSTSQLRNIKPLILSKIFQYSQFKQDQLTLENQNIVSQSKIITQELLSFARNKFNNITNELQQEKRKKLQYLIHKLNQFSKNYQQKIKLYNQQKIKQQNKQKLKIKQKSCIKNNNVIILQSDSQSQKFINQNKQELNSKTIHTLKNISNIQTKSFIYDWQQFQKRCNLVKQIFQTNQIIHHVYSPSFKDQNDSTQKINFNQPTSFQFFENHLSKQILQKLQSQTQKPKIQGFQPYPTKQ